MNKHNLIIIDDATVTAPPVPLYLTNAADYQKAVDTLVAYGCPRLKANVIAQTCDLLSKSNAVRSLSRINVLAYVNEAIHRLAEGETPSEVYNWITDLAINPD